MMKRNKISNFLVGVVLALLVLATPMAFGQEKVVLRFTHWWGGALKYIPDYWIEGFERENPGVKVEQTVVGFAEFAEKVLRELAAGVAPDLIEYNEGPHTKWILYDQILNISPYIERDKVDIDSIWPGTLNGYRDWWAKNDVYGFPILVTTGALKYNRDMYREVGLSFPEPATWTVERFMADCKKLTRDIDADGKIDVYGVEPGGLSWGWYAALYSFGAEIFSKDYKEFLLDSPEAIEYLQWASDLVWKYEIASSPLAAPAIGDLFLAKKVAMRQESTTGMMAYVGPKATVKIPFDWSAIRFPKKVRYGVVPVTNGVLINKNTKHKEEAWKFLKYVLTEGTAWLSDELHWPPVYATEENLEKYYEPFPYAPYDVRPCYYNLDEKDIEGHTMSYPAFPVWNDMQIVINREDSLVMLGKKTAQEAFEASMPKARKIFDEFWEKYGK